MLPSAPMMRLNPLKDLRLDADLSQEQIAALSLVSSNTVARYEQTRDFSFVKLGTLRRVCDALDAKLEVYIDGQPVTVMKDDR